MGAGGSKPAEPGRSSRHVFTSESPVQFSQGLVESLQASSETDSSRAQTLELQIQARVAEELERIRARETQTLADIEKRFAESTGESSTSHDSPISLDAPRVPFAGPGSEVEPATNAVSAQSELNSSQVAKEIESLKEKLASRPTVRKLDDGVENARGNVIKCLLDNDRKPLNCWKEVSTFKREVARMEKEWVEKIVG